MIAPVDPATDHADHLTFLKHLDQSHSAVWRVAQWLQERGNRVVVTPITKSATHQEWKDHADDGDLYIQLRVEVKKRGLEFTGREDWPHGDKFIVCAKHAWDRAKPKPYAFVILNKSMTHAAIVTADTRSQWTVEERTDSRYIQYRQEFYFIPIDLVRFVPLSKEQRNSAGEYTW